jgi:hypothetical protein
MKSKNNWKRVKHDRQNPLGELISITNQGLTFSAQFIKAQKLLDKQAVAVMKGDDDFKLGFEFLDEHETCSYKLVISSGRDNTATRQCNAQAIIKNSKILSKIRDLPSREDRSFKVQQDESGIYFIQLDPNFEYSVQFSDIKTVDSSLSGIYRCLDSHENVVYIGSGLIKTEATNAQKKCETQFKYIEYSIIPDRDEAFGWERHYQEKHRKKYGDLPMYNKVLAPNKKIVSLEALND